MGQNDDRWSGGIGFTLATIGSAVGLGSIWKFPYEVGSNGGGSFVLFYVAGLVLIVVPLMLAEFAIGRRGRADSAGSIAVVAGQYGAARRWALVGTLGILTGFLILSFYSVIGGWTIAFAVDTIRHGLPGTEARMAQERFDALLASPLSLSLHHAVFMALTAAVVARGVTGGIEAASKVLMPILILLILLLAIYSLAEGGAAATLRFLFAPDPAHLTARTALEALGLGFFSIGVGLGVMITYAAYAGEDMDIGRVAVVTVVADTAISLLAGFAVFPIVFANGLNPASGPGLVFVTLPLGFARMPFGTLAAVAFFVLLFVAALASAISLLEMAVALIERIAGWSRPRAVAAAAATCWAIGLASALSFNLWAGWHPLAALPGFATATWFDLLDDLTSNVMLPVGGFALALFAGWALPERMLAAELAMPPATIALLRVLLRYVAPAGIAAATLLPLIR